MSEIALRCGVTEQVLETLGRALVAEQESQSNRLGVILHTSFVKSEVLQLDTNASNRVSSSSANKKLFDMFGSDAELLKAARAAFPNNDQESESSAVAPLHVLDNARVMKDGNAAKAGLTNMPSKLGRRRDVKKVEAESTAVMPLHLLDNAKVIEDGEAESTNSKLTVEAVDAESNAVVPLHFLEVERVTEGAGGHSELEIVAAGEKCRPHTLDDSDGEEEWPSTPEVEFGVEVDGTHHR